MHSRDVFGGRSASYQKQLSQLTATALSELEDKAEKLRAAAIVGVKLDYAEMSGGGKAGMFMVVATGTPVLLDSADLDQMSESLPDTYELARRASRPSVRRKDYEDTRTI